LSEIHGRLPKGLHVELVWAFAVAPGMQGCSNLQKGTVTINQAKYTKDVLKRFNMQKVKLSFFFSSMNNETRTGTLITEITGTPIN
jgi:hypothetical protein